MSHRQPRPGRASENENEETFGVTIKFKCIIYDGSGNEYNMEAMIYV